MPAVFRNARLAPHWACFFRVGLTVGVSLLATPVRFTAQSITRPVALLEVAKIGLLLYFGSSTLPRRQ